MNDYQNQLNRHQNSQLEQELSEAMVKSLLRLCEENKSKARGAWGLECGTWGLGKDGAGSEIWRQKKELFLHPEI